MSAADSSLLELFREEVRSNVQVLNDGLVALEQGPAGPDQIEPLMRAAHSIKGAGRVVGVEVAVRVAHVMEDCLVQAQNGQLTLGSGEVDRLLRGADLLAQIADAGGDAARWAADHATAVEVVVDHLRAVANGPTDAKSQAANTDVNAEAMDADATTQAAHWADSEGALASARTVAVEGQDRVVRVKAHSLTRLMGLAGESLVEARWLQPFSDSLLKLKQQHSQLATLCDDLAQALADDHNGDDRRALLGEMHGRLHECQSALVDRIDAFESHARRSDELNSRLYNEVIASRMRPFRDGVQGFPRMVRDLARDLGKKVQFEVRGQMTDVDRDILEKLESPLTHILRNALDHGVEVPAVRTAAGKPETARLTLEARHNAGMLVVTVSDDGSGIDLDRLRQQVVERRHATADMVAAMSEGELLDFLFLPGFSTAERITEVSGRGVGLDVVHSMVHAVGGTVRIQTQAGQGTRFLLQLPITLSVIRAVLVEIAGELYALPHNRIDRLLRVTRGALGSLEYRQYFEVDGRNVGIVLGRQLLELEAEEASEGDVFVVVFSNHTDQFGLVVDRFCGEQDLVVRPLDPRLGKVRDCSAAAILDDGSPVLIADLDDMRLSIEKLLQGGRLGRVDEHPDAHRERRTKCVLVVDDSLTVREVERQLLLSRGYHVETAVDGVDGWSLVREKPFDLVISDIDMPRMNGLELVRHIKQDSQRQSTPVIIVSYKDRPEDQQRGLEVGANYYLTKSSFHDNTLLDAVRELIGDATT